MEVELKCYDLSKGVASMIAGPLLGLELEGVWHTSILFGGIEWFYGGGIQRAPPAVVEREYGMTPLKVLKLGRSSVTVESLHAWCNEHADEFSETQYDFLAHNCNHFSDAVARFLLGQGIPHEVLNQHEVISRNPGGKMLVNMVDAFQRQARQSQAQGGLAGFLATGRPVAQEAPIPQWSNEPDAFEHSVKQLWEDESVNMDVKKESLRRLHLLAQNLVNNATDPKFRTVKADNAKLRASLLASKTGADALVALGFNQERAPDGTLVYTVGQKITKELLMHLNRAAKLLAPVARATEQQVTPSPQNLETSYSYQLRHLSELGFVNRKRNLRILHEVHGNLNQAIDQLLADNGAQDEDDDDDDYA
ncbi:putative peptidase [Gregarina niphandrodes]|uniref:Peptidase n=1 Tax=Gregarina niphandrodes TaxID=110365 RepID=A0A023B309_GRENI|nr:putative peptidase [Gregarina niphandrodes]EZG55241.1 putative peptidase [Gregarina niphandrodes]|eukprot:XP_011131692.1 putative peptidase [Gregarina niphandrodes]